MTYVSPELTLIGQATGVVLGKVSPGTFDNTASPFYDVAALLETEW